jgi:hypothetical protein
MIALTNKFEKQNGPMTSTDRDLRSESTEQCPKQESLMRGSLESQLNAIDPRRFGMKPQPEKRSSWYIET